MRAAEAKSPWRLTRGLAKPPAVSCLGGLRTPAPVCAAPPSWGRHPKTFTKDDIGRLEARQSHRDLGVRRPAPLVEPGAILRRHLRAVRLRRMPLTRGCLLAVFRRAPPHLDAVVRVIGHFEVCCPVDDLLERKRPLRAIAAGVGYFSRGKLGRNYPLQLAFHVPDTLVLRHRVARRQPNDAMGKSPHDIDCDQQTEIARRSGVILP